MNFRLSIISTLFTALGLALLLSLGTWQTLRYNEKLRFEQARDARAHLPTLTAHSEHLSSGEADFRHIRLLGTWDKEQSFLIKHRIFEGKPGFWVINTFTLANGGPSLLVNRGWIPFDGGESLALSLLDDLPDTEIILNGFIHLVERPVADEHLRAQLQSTSAPTPKVQTLNTYDLDAMHAALKSPTFARPIVLTLDRDADSTQALPIASLDHITSPYLTSETHLGYAITWFSLAAALIAIWLAHGFGLLRSTSFIHHPRHDSTPPNSPSI